MTEHEPGIAPMYRLLGTDEHDMVRRAIIGAAYSLQFGSGQDRSNAHTLAQFAGMDDLVDRLEREATA